MTKTKAMRILLFGSKSWCLLLFLTISNIVAAQSPQKQPNIVWIVCEDIGPYIGAYGYAGVKTPNIDRLASEGVKYNRVFTTAGVCAPSRSTFITGMYQTSIGTQHMRTLNENNLQNVPADIGTYSAVIPPYVKCFPEYLRKEGYYTTNNEKQDYQFIPPVTVWDENSAAASWRNRAPGQPFFSVFNLAITHEMFLFTREKEPLTEDPQKVVIPQYYPQSETAAKAVARQLTNIEIMDGQVGEIIQLLKDDGLYDDAWIIFYSDHAGALPWMKRELLDRGTHIPFIVKYPEGQLAGTVNDELISGVDFAPTVLSLAGVPIPAYLQGQAFLGSQKSPFPRQYIFSARDRMGPKYDRVRAVSDGRYRYLYNYMPELPYYQDLGFRKSIPLMREILALKESGQLPASTQHWFDTKPVEELYDTQTDADEFKNLVADPAYQDKLDELRAAFQTWRNITGDRSTLSERKMIDSMWNGLGHPPRTAPPVVVHVDSGVKIYCDTEGASIGYQVVKLGESAEKLKHQILSWDFASALNRVGKNGEEFSSDRPWAVYQSDRPIQLNKGDTLIVKALRIGYEEATNTYIEK